VSRGLYDALQILMMLVGVPAGILGAVLVFYAWVLNLRAVGAEGMVGNSHAGRGGRRAVFTRPESIALSTRSRMHSLRGGALLAIAAAVFIGMTLIEAP
jgi:hypothetical protein